MGRTTESWYPAIKTRQSPDCPDLVNQSLWETPQVVETWAIEGSVGPETMTFIDGHFFWWMPAVTIERAVTRVRCLHV